MHIHPLLAAIYTIHPHTTWYAILDGDGYGIPFSTISNCEQPPNYVNNGDDCDDPNDIINPNSPGICHGLDNNCNGDIDTVEDSTFYGTGMFCPANRSQDIINTNSMIVDGNNYVTDLNRANLYDNNSCCKVGNTSNISKNSDWRYTIYI